jgi:hypothetical protein
MSSRQLVGTSWSQLASAVQGVVNQLQLRLVCTNRNHTSFHLPKEVNLLAPPVVLPRLEHVDEICRLRHRQVAPIPREAQRSDGSDAPLEDLHRLFQIPDVPEPEDERR